MVFFLLGIFFLHLNIQINMALLQVASYLIFVLSFYFH